MPWDHTRTHLGDRTAHAPRSHEHVGTHVRPRVPCIDARRAPSDKRSIRVCSNHLLHSWLLGACGGMLVLISWDTGCQRGAPGSRRSGLQDARAPQSSAATANAPDATGGEPYAAPSDFPHVPIPQGFPPDVPLYPGTEYRSTSHEERYIQLVLSTPDAVDAVDAWYRTQRAFSENTDGMLGFGGGGFYSVGRVHFLMLQDELATKLLVEIEAKPSITEIKLIASRGAGCASEEAKIEASGDC